MSDLLKKKLEIAKRAAELSAEITSFSGFIKRLEGNKNCNDGPDTITVQVYFNNSNTYYNIKSYEHFDNPSTLHDALISLITPLVEKRESEINDLIRIVE